MELIGQEQKILQRLCDGPYRWSSVGYYSIKEAEIFHDDRPLPATRRPNQTANAHSARTQGERQAINLRLICPRLQVPRDLGAEPSPLLRLPGEIRDNIWRYVMDVFNPLSVRPLTPEEAFHVRGQRLRMHYSDTYRGNKRIWEADIPGYGFTFELPSGWHLHRSGVFKRDQGGRPASFACDFLDTAVFLLNKQVYAEVYNILIHERNVKIERYADCSQFPGLAFTPREVELFSSARHIIVRTAFFSDMATLIERLIRRSDIKSLEITFDSMTKNRLDDINETTNWIPELLRLAPIKVGEKAEIYWSSDSDGHYKASGLSDTQYKDLIRDICASMLGEKKTDIGRRLVLRWNTEAKEVEWKPAPYKESGHGFRSFK